MERTLLTSPLRFLAVLIGAWLAQLVAVIGFSTVFQPSPLRFDAPEAGVIAARFREAQKLIDQGEYDLARDRLEGLRKINPLNPLIHAELGQVYRKLNQIPEAMMATRAALNLDPYLGEAAYNLATDLVKQGNADQALKWLQKAISLNLDVRTLAARDPDLEPLDQNDRWVAFKEGAGILPLDPKNATVRLLSRDIAIGQTFELRIDGASLSEEIPGSAIPFAVAYRGSRIRPEIKPLRRDHQVRRWQQGEKLARAWTVSYQFSAEDAFVGTLGPFEIQIDGVIVPVEPLNLVISPLGEVACTSTKNYHKTAPTPAALDQFFATSETLARSHEDAGTIWFEPRFWSPRGTERSQGTASALHSVALCLSHFPEGTESRMHVQFGSSPRVEFSYEETFTDGTAPDQRHYCQVFSLAPNIEDGSVDRRIAARITGLPDAIARDVELRLDEIFVQTPGTGSPDTTVLPESRGLP